jgi:hypothetical protein
LEKPLAEGRIRGSNILTASGQYMGISWKPEGYERRPITIPTLLKSDTRNSNIIIEFLRVKPTLSYFHLRSAVSAGN